MTDTLFPVQITDDAWNQIRSLLARKGGDGTFLRIGVKGGGCSGFEYVFRLDDRELPIDLITEREGAVVRLDSKSAEFLAGATLVYTGNLLGGGFAFENPNAVRSCGCGTSFTPRDKTG